MYSVRTGLSLRSQHSGSGSLWIMFTSVSAGRRLRRRSVPLPKPGDPEGQEKSDPNHCRLCLLTACGGSGMASNYAAKKNARMFRGGRELSSENPVNEHQVPKSFRKAPERAQ